MIANRFIAMVLACFAAAIPVAAQKGWETPRAGEFPFSFGPMGLSVLMREAGLSEAQMRQFGEIFQSNRHQLIDLRADVEKKEGDLQVLLEASQVDLAPAERSVDALLEARGRLAKASTMMMVRMRQVVTQEQWRKMAELQRRISAPPPPPAPRPAPLAPGPQPGRGLGPGAAPAPPAPPPPARPLEGIGGPRLVGALIPTPAQQIGVSPSAETAF